MVDPRIVIPVAAGSSPVLHPSKSFGGNGTMVF